MISFFVYYSVYLVLHKAVYILFFNFAQTTSLFISCIYCCSLLLSLAYVIWRTTTFSSRPTIDTKLPLMAANITFEQVKNLSKQELAPVNAKLEELANQLNEIDSTVNFLSDNYNELLSKIKNTNENYCVGHCKH